MAREPVARLIESDAPDGTDSYVICQPCAASTDYPSTCLYADNIDNNEPLECERCGATISGTREPDELSVFD